MVGVCQTQNCQTATVPLLLCRRLLVISPLARARPSNPRRHGVWARFVRDNLQGARLTVLCVVVVLRSNKVQATYWALAPAPAVRASGVQIKSRKVFFLFVHPLAAHSFFLFLFPFFPSPNRSSFRL